MGTRHLIRGLIAATAMIIMSHAAQAAPVPLNINDADFSLGAFNPGDGWTLDNPDVGFLAGEAFMTPIGQFSQELETVGNVPIAIEAGTYIVSFDVRDRLLGGNPFNGDLVVELYDVSTDIALTAITPNLFDSFIVGGETQTVSFNVGSAVGLGNLGLRFITSGGNQGQILLDNVSATFDVPEPGTLALLGLGAIGVGVARRRKLRAA